MTKRVCIIVALVLIGGLFMNELQAEDNVAVKMVTNMGTIELELYSDKAPKTVDNFIKYVESGFYNGTIFHRVINNFMIQGGGFDVDGNQKKATFDQIHNEADNMLSNKVGTIAMARTSYPHSATSQFFINVKDNDFLDHQDEKRGWGYCVFGKVTKGMDVVNAIKVVPTHINPKTGMKDWPVENVIIESVVVLDK